MNANCLKVFMPSDKVKNAREWGTFLLSLIAVVFLPIIAVVLKNQRLENERWTADNFISQKQFIDFKSEQDKRDDKDAATVQAQISAANAKADKVEAKVDAVSAKVDASLMSLNTVQAQLQILSQQGKSSHP